MGEDCISNLSLGADFEKASDGRSDLLFFAWLWHTFCSGTEFCHVIVRSCMCVNVRNVCKRGWNEGMGVCRSVCMFPWVEGVPRWRPWCTTMPDKWRMLLRNIVDNACRQLARCWAVRKLFIYGIVKTVRLLVLDFSDFVALVQLID